MFLFKLLTGINKLTLNNINKIAFKDYVLL